MQVYTYLDIYLHNIGGYILIYIDIIWYLPTNRVAVKGQVLNI